ncbi:hypothetical protein V1264_016279 [Littorina saxatilis]|uniref:Fibronectin type III-like domain-containing protein n=1 Tax=Littorina saxatilis TaxID=31220 RepID=A0AAN9BRW7_9CAEN
MGRNSSLWFFSAILIAGVGDVLCNSIRDADGDDYPFRNVSLPWDVRVDDIVKRLTLEEMQLQMARGGAGKIGGPAPAISRLGIGPYEWDTECLRGDVRAPDNATAFPQALGLAAAFSYDLLFRVAEATGVEVRGKHNDFVKQGNYGGHTGASCFSPVINIMRDSRWGRNQETYGEDPYLSGIYATAYVKGLQGNDPRYVRASAGCKHFDVHGGPENIPANRGSFDAEVSEEDWRMTHLPAFKRCVEAGTYNLMCSYNRINGVPSCANKKLLTDITRGEWGFKGYVISDEGAIENIIYQHHYLNNSVDTVAACVNAGCNLELSGNLKTPVYFSLVDAVKQGKVTEDKVRESVRPLFYTRMRLGEFDPPEMNPYSKLSSAEVETAEHKALAVEAAMKSFVLLKNNGILPLKGKPYSKIGVVGPFANTTQIIGDYSPIAPNSVKTTALQALTTLAQNVQFAQGCDQVSAKCVQYDSQSVIKAVAGTDVNFVLLGTGTISEAEGNDRPDTELPGQQRQLLQDVLANTKNTPVVVLLFNAGPVNISFADQDPRVAAILECFFPAQATGEAIGHVLLNDVTGAVPAGRLPYTWPMLASQLPPMVNYSMEGRTYRYFEGEPLYPFGYGLSYTTFQYSDLSYTSAISAGQPLSVSLTVTNTGSLDADEVVQVYIQWKDASLPAPKIQLAWFNRVTIAAGQKSQLSFEVEARTMALWINDGWFVKPGTMEIFAGGQQPNVKRTVPSNVLTGAFTITGTKYLGRY